MCLKILSRENVCSSVQAIAEQVEKKALRRQCYYDSMLKVAHFREKEEEGLRRAALLSWKEQTRKTALSRMQVVAQHVSKPGEQVEYFCKKV